MKDLKIRVANKSESKEAQELFFELGYYWAYRNIGKKFHYEDGDVFIFAGSDRILGSGIAENTDFFNNHGSKEITLQELRNMVFFKSESLNDKIASAEVARQEEKHSHYKKDISHLNVIDPYRIADLYNLHPCAEHIMKKSLCAGNRGHKDTLRDIQDIIDTAERWKQMIEEDSQPITLDW